MELVFLHGPPAVGKLTVAQKLGTLIPARVMDNHATIDLALKVFDFGTAEFWDLVYQLRLAMLDAAARSDLPYLITTACYAHPQDLPIVEGREDVMLSLAAALKPVHLTCPPTVLAERVVSAERGARGKINTVQGLNAYLARNAFVPLPRPGCLVLNTETLSPDQAANEIALWLSRP